MIFVLIFGFVAIASLLVKYGRDLKLIHNCLHKQTEYLNTAVNRTKGEITLALEDFKRELAAHHDEVVNLVSRVEAKVGTLTDAIAARDAEIASLKDARDALAASEEAEDVDQNAAIEASEARLAELETSVAAATDELRSATTELKSVAANAAPEVPAEEVPAPAEPETPAVPAEEVPAPSEDGTVVDGEVTEDAAALPDEAGTEDEGDAPEGPAFVAV